MTATLEIELSTPVNLRDLGGTPIAGGTLRDGVAIRTDDLATVTPEFAATLVTDGLAAIIDLRSPHEVQVTGRGPLADYPVAYHHLPFMGSIEAPAGDAPELTHELMGEMYVGMIDRAAPLIVTALDIIANATGATAFHCAAGRDRTGVLAACLLLVLGADDDVIVADYARTGPNMPAIMARTRTAMSAVFEKLGIDPTAFDGAALTDDGMDVSMRILLGSLRERHGDALAPLHAAGLTGDTIAKLRARALGA
ncbi:tyrosine-protein phosphatase [Leucobacter sp. NPDC015123]|uniref:tyrosine-protein phosphatase n=1 Tax=Leucobacter sp. NPDC015123 TaxID=3364129 RepID=UPI0036F4590A